MEQLLPTIIAIALAFGLIMHVQRDRAAARPVLARVPVETGGRRRRRRSFD